VRFGIVGCGTISTAHAEAIVSLPDAQLVAVADPITERAATMAERYHVCAYADLTAMLQAEQLDVVNVCTASGLHGPQAVEIMHSGRHVIVEKPMAISLVAIDEMLRVQAECGVKLAVISQHRFEPAIRALHRLIGEDALGRLVLGSVHILWWRSQAYYDTGAWRGTWAMDGGGVLMNQGIHSIDLLCWLLGPDDPVQPVVSVCAYTDTLTHRIETEDTAVASLRFRSGALGSIAATTSAYPGVTTRLDILGDRGSALIEQERLTYLHLARDDAVEIGPYGLESRLPAEVSMIPDDLLNEKTTTLSPHALQIADMLRAIREDGTPLVDGHAARHPIEVILAIYESARTGREVILS
jgi:predicted dehydrogenase